MAVIPANCPVTDLDPWCDEALADPYPVYRELRHLGPVVWLAAWGVPVLPRFAEVRSVLSDHGRFSSAAGACLDETMAREMGESILTSDPPVHETYRRPLANQLSPSALEADSPAVARAARDLVDRLVAAGSFDAVTDLASPFSVNVVADLVGLPPEGREQIGPLGERAFNIMGPADARHADGMEALAALAEYSVGAAVSGCLRPGSRGAALTEAGTPDFVMAYTWPGVDTTVHALASAVLCFAQHPDQWDLLRSDPMLIPSAFNEVLRLHTPVQTFTRVTTCPVDIGHIQLRAGQRVAVMFGSANRDERHYPEPDHFDIARNPRDQLAFGRGIHMCVGVHLARLEAHHLLQALVGRVARFTLTAEPRWKLNNTLHGLATLPIRVQPA